MSDLPAAILYCSGCHNANWKCTVKHLNRMFWPMKSWIFIDLCSHSLGHINLLIQHVNADIILQSSHFIFISNLCDMMQISSRLLKQFKCLMRYLKMFYVYHNWHAIFIKWAFIALRVWGDALWILTSFIDIIIAINIRICEQLLRAFLNLSCDHRKVCALK